MQKALKDDLASEQFCTDDGDSATEAPRKPGALPNCNRSELQAAALVGWTSKTLPELAIGIARPANPSASYPSVETI